MGGLVPIEYDADGRTLKINAVEATTIRKLYDPCKQHGNVRVVKELADRLGLKAKIRGTKNTKSIGGGPFTRGHIYQILTNPLYAGRIRHRKAVHLGQHPAIIDPDRWEQMIDLALLATDIVRDVLDRKQPVGFTSDWMKQHNLPSDWSDQRKLLATL